MELVFLGTGGGRFNLIAQARRTGGFRINGPLSFHVDPGPGALSSCIAYGQPPGKLDYVVATHNHIDHVNDAGLMIEAMTTYKKMPGKPLQGAGSKSHNTYPKRGGIIGSKSILVGDEYGERAVSSYHLGRLLEKHVAIPGKKITLPSGSKKPLATLTPIPTVHDDATGFGFVLEMSGARIGYTSDTEYFEGIARHYSGCDILVANNLKARQDGVGGHLCSEKTISILKKARPRLAVLTHFGISLIRAGPEKEAARISEKSGVRTIAAKDGMRISPGQA
jgi:ribonuclease BN (tRNA processing enzyme)